MSDYGEVGYINPSTAAESCYRSVKQCQIVVLIVGRRYGTPGDDGMSATHREFATARAERIPTITFVEPEVLNYKDVFETDKNAAIWSDFKPMDNPRRTFELLDEVARSEAYNAIIPFTSVRDAKTKLKLQLADFVGDRLAEVIQPARKELQEVLAQIKTLRNQIVHSSASLEKTKDSSKQYLITMRYLLDDQHADYRRLVEQLFHEIDAAIERLIQRPSFDDLMKDANYRIEVIPDEGAQEALRRGFDTGTGPHRIISGSYGVLGGYVISADRLIRLNESQYRRFEQTHNGLLSQLTQQFGKIPRAKAKRNTG
jgi:uncharacterized protein DUF4062